jgi:hypothetical protein
VSADNGGGYKKPPESAQFISGQSGNPRGRPKGSRNLKTDLNDLMKKRIVVREDGETRNISRQEAMLLGLFSKAARGDVRAAATLVNMVMKLNPETEALHQSTDVSENDKRIIEDFLRRHGAHMNEDQQ